MSETIKINPEVPAEHQNESRLYHSLLAHQQRRLGLQETSLEEVRATFDEDTAAQFDTALNSLTETFGNPRVLEVVKARWALNGEGKGAKLDELAPRFNVTRERIRQMELQGARAIAEQLFPELVNQKPKTKWEAISDGDFTQIAIYKDIPLFHAKFAHEASGEVVHYENLPEVHAQNKELVDGIKAEYGEDNVIEYIAKDTQAEDTDAGNPKKATALPGHSGVYVRTKVFDDISLNS
jgi:hypothetical protein